MDSLQTTKPSKLALIYLCLPGTQFQDLTFRYFLYNMKQFGTMLVLTTKMSQLVGLCVLQ